MQFEKVNWLRYLWSVFLLSAAVVFPARAADSAEEPQLGVLMRIYKEVDGDINHWTDRFCQLAHAHNGTDYARFVRMVRFETTSVLEHGGQMRGSESILFFARNSNRQRVFECLEHDGEAALAETQYDLYVLNRYGRGARPNYWIRKAAYGGSPQAQVAYASLIGLFLDNPQTAKPADVLEEDIAPQRHYFWLTRAAESNFPLGQYRLARLHLGPWGRDWRKAFIDASRAITILEKVAAQNEDELSQSSAARDLGELYFVGKQVPQDYARALEWFLRVDEKFYNHCRDPLRWVRSRLVQIYKNGLGVEQNPERVNYYMRTAGVGC